MIKIVFRSRIPTLLSSVFRGSTPLEGHWNVHVIPALLTNADKRFYCKTPNNNPENILHNDSKPQSADESSLQSDSDSSSSSDEEFGEEELRTQILNAALPFVKIHGWTAEAISSGSETLGYSGMAHGMFSDGGVELVNYFNKSCNKKLEQTLKSWAADQDLQTDTKRSTTKFLRDSIKERLQMNIEYIDTWPQAMALNAAPTNTSNALYNIGTLVDHMWYYAGDRSNDFNWYTKRGVIALVYKSTELCMVQDDSIDYKDTWEFLDRRLSDVHAAAKCIKDANNYTKDITNLAQAGVLTALNIIGMNKKTR